MKNIVIRLRQQGKIVALTCYTGIACLQYKGLGAVTLHKFSGLEDGRHTDADLYLYKLFYVEISTNYIRSKMIELYGDFGHYCFEVDFFNKIFPHIVTLKNAHHQASNEDHLITAVNGLEKRMC